MPLCSIDIPNLLTTILKIAMEKKFFLLLFALNRSNANVGREVLAHVKTFVDVNAAPAFLHSGGVGILMASTDTSLEIWGKVWPKSMTDADRDSMRDASIFELGSDCTGLERAKPIAWLIKYSGAEFE